MEKCLAALVMAALATVPAVHAQQVSAPYLYVWAGDGDKQESDFLAVLDVRPGSPTYARVLSTLPVGATGTTPHHTEHQLEIDRVLFANGFGAGRTFRFDLGAPAEPRLLGSFTELGGYSFPHSFVRLANGNLLATFQGRGPGNTPPGGLVELDREGRFIRGTNARAPGFDSTQMRPYSLAVLPAIDRVVSTSTDMTDEFGAHLQIWRLSDLALLSTVELPATTAGDGHAHEGVPNRRNEDHHLFPGEPRTLADGRTVLLATFTCGFYRVTDIDSPTPRVEFLRAFAGMNCAVPILAGSYWIQTVPDEHALLVLDVRESAHPREISRVTFDSTFTPHWMAYDEGGSRLVVNDGRARMFLVAVNQQTGRLAIDSTFRDSGAAVPGVTFDRAGWPHGATGPAVPHGSVFARPERDLLGEAADLYQRYGAALREGRRADIATAYDRAGARIIFNGVPRQASWVELDARYRGPWRPPTQFRWDSLAFQVIGPSHVLVTGGFWWQSAGEADSTRYQYTAVLAASDSTLGITFEQETLWP
ncbi:MAG TPA: selenium-binding protein SBP56-related protein [Gemmatimonadales bacterium]|nr:selenium-binding protein SBP56-related protein [Gemmatimonadales bacterium]